VVAVSFSPQAPLEIERAELRRSTNAVVILAPAYAGARS